MDDLDRQILRTLQDGLALVPEPYAAAAAELGIDRGLLIERLHGMLERGEVRRIGASVAHRKAGFVANVMCVWRVPAGAAASFGRAAAQRDAVTHCYERDASPEWPHNVYAMIHGRTREACEAVIADICRSTGQTDYVALYSTREFKKTWTRL